MLEQEINEQLGLLQEELSRLKKATDYIDGARESSESVITELEKVQQNYAVYTDKIFGLHKQYADDLKKNTEIQVNEGVLKFETTGNKIETVNREKLVETKRLLEQYKKTVEATDNLVTKLDAIDFPERLSSIGKNIQSVGAALNQAMQSVENRQNESQTILTQRFDQQDKEIKALKILLYLICGLVLAGMVATILVTNYK